MFNKQLGLLKMNLIFNKSFLISLRKKSYFSSILSSTKNYSRDILNRNVFFSTAVNKFQNSDILAKNLNFNKSVLTSFIISKKYSNQGQKHEANLDEEKEKERERIRNRQIKVTKITFFVMCGIFTGCIGWALINWGSPKYDEQGEEVKDRFSQFSLPKQYLLRTWAELVNVQESFTGPSRDLLLPPPLTYPYVQPPYTLVLELKSLLVHFDWDYQNGWGCKTRPFLKKFLEQVGPPNFEVVIFTELSPTTAFGILEAMDRDGYIMHRLFKDSTRFINGKHIKDLNVLNRDLSKTIQIEVDKDACSLNPRNCLVLEKWKGDTLDTQLLDLASFLSIIKAQNIDDVREIISHYSQFDKPLDVFKENQFKMIEEEERRKKKKDNSLASSFKRKF